MGRIWGNKRYIAAVSFLGAFLVLAGSLIAPLTASAGMFDGWFSSDGVSEGFFSHNGWSDINRNNRQNCYGSGNLRCPVIPNDNYARNSLNAGYYHGGNSSSAASIQRAQQLVADLKSFYNNPTYWYNTGAAFIVNTMLGYNINSPQKSRTVTAAMWNDLEQRLVARASAGRINWNIDIRGGEKDTYVRILRNADGGWRHDVVYDYEPQIKNGIEIYNDDGSVAYQIWYQCANPIGNVAGLQRVDFKLNPTITVTPTVAEGGSGNATISPVVNNGGTTPSTNAQWQVTTFTVAPGGTVPGAAVNGSNPTGYYQNGASVIASGSRTFPRNNTNIPVNPQLIPDKPVGTKICYALSVQPYSQSDGSWSHSKPACITIAKNPKTQVWGGDLIVGRGLAAPGSSIRTSVTQQQTSGKMYGSWAEYGILPSGGVVGMASGSGYGSGNALNTPLCSVSLLTFTNRGAAGCSDTTIGKYTLGGGVAASIVSRFPTSPSTPQVVKDADGRVDIKNLSSGITYTSNDGTLKVRSSNSVAAGKWVVINAPNTTITIDGNIAYTPGPYPSIAALPQVIIIAKNIIVSDGVGQIDSWLLATGKGTDGRINTCGAGVVDETTLPTSKQCGGTLQIDGPVMANHLFLRRTAGAGTGAQAGNPGEIFNLRPDAYLWASNLQRATGKATTVMTTEMPPRF